MTPSFLQWALRVIAWLAPRSARESWRREWVAESEHYAAMLENRGLDAPEIRSRLRRHYLGAFADAWYLRVHCQVLPGIQVAMRKPSFSLAIIAVGLVGMAIASRGFRTTRSMIAPPYPDAGRLVLIDESGIMKGQRLTISPALLEFWAKHNTTLEGMAGYTWDAQGKFWMTPGFAGVLGIEPHHFLLKEIRAREWIAPQDKKSLGVLGRLKAGVTAVDAEYELQTLARMFRNGRKRYPFPEAEVTPLMERVSQPLRSYATICLTAGGILFGWAAVGMWSEYRRNRRVRGRYWSFFFAKSVGILAVLALATWEFSYATSMTRTGGTPFFAEPFTTWLFIIVCGGCVSWCFADQRARCRACVVMLQNPVRIGSIGAILFDHAGTEFVCCEGHGVLYVPEVSSDYVQQGGWTTMNYT